MTHLRTHALANDLQLKIHPVASYISILIQHFALNLSSINESRLEPLSTISTQAPPLTRPLLLSHGHSEPAPTSAPSRMDDM